METTFLFARVCGFPTAHLHYAWGDTRLRCCYTIPRVLISSLLVCPPSQSRWATGWGREGRAMTQERWAGGGLPFRPGPRPRLRMMGCYSAVLEFSRVIGRLSVSGSPGPVSPVSERAVGCRGAWSRGKSHAGQSWPMPTAELGKNLVIPVFRVLAAAAAERCQRAAGLI